MKQVVNKSKMVDINDISYNKYYGVINEDGLKQMIVRQQTNSISSSRVIVTSIGNLFSNIMMTGTFPDVVTITMAQLIKNYVNSGFTVHEFDTVEDLFKWMVN